MFCKLEKLDYFSAKMGGDFRLKEVSIHSRSNPNVVHLNSAGVFNSLDILISERFGSTNIVNIFNFIK